MIRRLLVIALASALLTSCTRGSEDFAVGVKRVALALAFAEEELAEPVAPNIIRQYAPAPPEVDLASPPPPEDVVFDFVNPLACPTAPPGASPTEAVGRTVTEPPAPGPYLRHNQGTVEVSGGIVPITLPFPPLTRWEIGPTEVVPRQPGPLTGSPFDTTPAGEDHDLDIRKVILEGSFVVTDRVRITHNEILLLTRTTEASGTTTVFTPDPPITLYQFGAEATEWRSAGVDTQTNTAMLVQGKIEKREVIDVCGTPIDTYRVTVSESSVNLQTGESSGTDPDRPNIYNVAPHHGGLFVREDVRSSTHARDPESGAPITVVLEYVSTISSMEPTVL